MAADTAIVREQQAVRFTAVCHQAKRVIPKTKTFEADMPTQWDCLHEHMDTLTTELLGH